jgi:hypothetical protein
MSGQEPVTRGSVFYWVGFVILWIAIITLVWTVFRPAHPETLGI